MLPSQHLIEYIKRREGLSLEAYKPLASDVWTIGYGATQLENRAVREEDTITLDTANRMIEDYLDDLAMNLSRKRIPTTVTQQQFDAVVSLAYNIGCNAFITSVTGKMFYAGEDIASKFPLWIKSDGKVIPGLINRRKMDLQIYEDGVYV